MAIATEATISVGVLASRHGHLGVLLMLAFHVVMLGATRGQLSLPFTYASLAVAAPFFFPRVTAWRRWVEPAMWWVTALSIRAVPHLMGLI